MKDVVVITGASSGIGAKLVELFSSLSYQVLAIARNEQKLLEIKQAAPDLIETRVSDISLEEERELLLASLPTDITIKFLIHCAGILSPVGALDDLNYQVWRENIATNLEAPIFLTKMFLPHFSPGARVLQISSGAAHKAIPGWTTYCIAKAATFMLYQCLRQELSPRNIWVGSMLPGIVDTPMQAQIRSLNIKDFPLKDNFVRFKEEDKLIDPMVVAKFIVWLLEKVPSEQFVDKEWDVYDEAHHREWLDGGVIPKR